MPRWPIGEFCRPAALCRARLNYQPSPDRLSSLGLDRCRAQMKGNYEPDSTSDDFAPNTVLDGRWQLVRKLGEGGMGSVYEARNRMTQHRVAIKILSSEGAQHPAAVQRFRREAQIVAEIGDERFCQTYDFGQWQGRYYLVMQLLEGRTLTDYAGQEQLTVEQAVGVVISACHALQIAHDKGVVHRDLKPDNLFITNSGALIILDLGIAKMRSDSAFRTATHAVVGTPSTMSPEQCLGSDIDHRSDVYSLCTVLYKLLSGRYPFDGLPGEVLVNHIRDEVPSLQTLAPLLPPGLVAVVHQNLAKKPEARLSSMRALAMALQPFAVGHGGLTPTLRSLPVSTPSLHGQLEARRGLQPRWPVLGLVFLVGGAGLGWALMRSPTVDSAHSQPAATPVARGRVFVSIVPPESTVHVDGKLWTAGSPVLLDDIVGGRHRLDLSGHGRVARTEHVEVGPGDAQLRLVLAEPEPTTPTIPASPPSPTSTPHELGTLLIHADPWAYVSVDGSKPTETPITLKLAAGNHRITASNPALKQQKDLVVLIKPHQKRVVSFDLREAP